MFLQILQKIKEYNRIIIHRHMRPDGDCIGSQMGLKYLIKASFPEKEVFAVGDEVPSYISGCGQSDEVSDDLYKDALVIVVDTSVASRICDNRYSTGAYLIKIDHHDDSEDFGNLAYVDPLSPACASIIVDFYLANQSELVMSQAAAKALLMGIITDTGRFKYRGTNSKTLVNASKLLEYYDELDELYTSLYIKEKEDIKLQGYVCENFKVTPNGVAYIYFDKETMEKYNVTKDTAAATVNMLDSIRGSLIWVTFVEQLKPYDETITSIEQPANEVRVRLRSRFVSINEIGKHFRGGGHLQAAGATIYSKEEMKQLLFELDETLRIYKENNPEKY